MGRKNKNKYRNQNTKQQNNKVTEERLEVIEPEVVIEVIEPVQQPINVQPVNNIQSQPVMQAVNNVQPQPVMQAVNNVQPQPVMQAVNNIQPQPVMQAVNNVQPQPVMQAVNNVQPQPVMQVVNNVQPQPTMQSINVQQPTNGIHQVVENKVNEQPVVAPVMNIKPKKKINLLITQNPKSSFSESIKSIRTNLQFSAVEKEIKVILVSSPEPGDGKSLISSNLAGAYAQENKKVLIIDCDLRKGRQAEIFGVKKTNTTGYTNLILKYNDPTTGNQPELEDYISKTDIENVELIPNGPTPPNPIELLSSSKNKELIDDLKEIYDIIILDCPPVLGLSDALVMTKYSDANIIVISKGKTKVESLAEVKKSFEKVNSTITGVITNKAKSKHNSYYGYYGE